MDSAREDIVKFLQYDPNTGAFIRIATANGKRRGIGKPCGCVNKVTGYVEISVEGRNQYGHRLAWIIVHGSIPEGARIDHENRNRADNRIDNLRCATHAQNLRNCNTRVDNTSGVKGVSWDRSRNQWMAYVGKRKLGRFASFDEAVSARKSAALAAFEEFANE